MKGIIILALGKHYGKWASNLASSIKWNSDLPISLLCNDEALQGYTDNSYKLFDKIIPVDKSLYGLNELKAKLHLYELSPYEETVYIDAENIMLPKLSVDDLFRKKFTIQSRGVINAKDAHKNPQFIHWGKVGDLADQYNLKSGKLYNLFSEYIYFKKDKKTKKIFEDAQKVWEELYGTSAISFNGAIPDEICFMVSLNQNKIEMEVFCPSYWEIFEKKKLRMGATLYNHYIYSMGGNLLSREMKEIYNGSNSLTQMYCKKQGTIPYSAKDKQALFPKRIKL